MIDLYPTTPMITINVNVLNTSIEGRNCQPGDEKQYLIMCCLQESHFKCSVFWCLFLYCVSEKVLTKQTENGRKFKLLR